MSDGHSLMEKQQQQLPVTNDGWNDAAKEAAERPINGTLLKFADWRWTAGKEATAVPDSTRLIAMATIALWTRWEDGKPVEYRIREAGHRLPERDELGYDDQSEWEIGPGGEPQDPWRNTRLVYLVHPRTAEAFTFSTSSWGGRGAVADLGDQIARMRNVHPDAVPIVELRAAEMPTKYGRKSKPVFKIVGWKTADGEARVAEREISPREAKRLVDESEMNDDIPY